MGGGVACTVLLLVRWFNMAAAGRGGKRESWDGNLEHVTQFSGRAHWQQEEESEKSAAVMRGCPKEGLNLLALYARVRPQTNGTVGIVSLCHKY